MTIMTVQIPDDVKEAFDKAFEGEDKNAVIARLGCFTPGTRASSSCASARACRGSASAISARSSFARAATRSLRAAGSLAVRSLKRRCPVMVSSLP